MRTVVVFDEDVMPDRCVIWSGGKRFDIHELYRDDEEVSYYEDEAIGVQNAEVVGEMELGDVVKFAEEIIDLMQTGEIEAD